MLEPDGEVIGCDRRSFGGLAAAAITFGARAMADVNATSPLPPPRREGDMALERALWQRRSIREFAAQLLAITEVGQLLFAAQGITDPRGLRTSPSAGALYPLELRLAVGHVPGLAAGVYRYDPRRHELVLSANGDRRHDLATQAFGQTWLGEGAVILVVAAVYERMTSKYGKRGERYVHIEVGHVVQNVYLQAAALGLAATEVGAFDDAGVHSVAALAADEAPLALIALGTRR
jgi:SagB-type dehydrogenase family enzyme